MAAIADKPGEAAVANGNSNSAFVSFARSTCRIWDNVMLNIDMEETTTREKGKRKLNGQVFQAQRDDSIRRTVYVSHIEQSASTTEEQLAGLFSNCGQVVDCRVCGDPHSVLRFAFVEFADEEGARAALALMVRCSGFIQLSPKMKGKCVPEQFIVQILTRRHTCLTDIWTWVWLYDPRRSLKYMVPQADVKNFLSPRAVTRLRILGDNVHSTRITANLDALNQLNAGEASNLNFLFIFILLCHLWNPTRSGKEAQTTVKVSGKEGENQTLFVQNIPPRYHWSGLRQLFGRHGDVEARYRAKNLSGDQNSLSTSNTAARIPKDKSIGEEGSEAHASRRSRTIQGVIDDDVVRKLQKCMVDTMATVCSSTQVEERLSAGGLVDVKTKFLGGRDFLIEIVDDELYRIMKGNKWSFLLEVFLEVDPWTESYRAFERVTWIKLIGVPLHCWNHNTFKRIAEQWGDVSAMGENTLQELGCEEMMILIATSKKDLIDEVFDLEAGRDVFKIRIVEQSTNRSETRSRTQEVEVNLATIDSSSSAGRSTNSSEEKNSERWQEVDDNHLCCMGNISKDGLLSGLDGEERNIGEEAILGQRVNDVSSGKSQKQYEDLSLWEGCLGSKAVEDTDYMGLTNILPKEGSNGIEDQLDVILVEPKGSKPSLGREEEAQERVPIPIHRILAVKQRGRSPDAVFVLEHKRRKNNNRWFMAGDFNAIRNHSERSGCSYRQTEIAVFNTFIEDCDWQSLDTTALFERHLLDRELITVRTIKREADKVSLNSSVVDRIVWVHETDGLFKVKKLTELLLSDGNFEDAVSFNFDKIWSLKVPPKVKYLLWMLKLSRVSTKAFLIKEGLSCPMLNTYALGVEMLKRMRTICLCHVFLCFAVALWSIWLARNDFCFRNKGIKLKDLIVYVKMRAYAWCKALKEFSVLDEKRWWDWPGESAGSSAYQSFKNVWQPPASGQLKFNVDGSASNKTTKLWGSIEDNRQSHSSNVLWASNRVRNWVQKCLYSTMEVGSNFSGNGCKCTEVK
ncbi:Polyadenylate-binding protein-interacting protein 9 [Hibiscus syriacus]|uniref:Polyadenylate-binding protein-interacting protein 9 n=1 Tax=Hibiscus syriacus TaxID=106335 RepID=A0A6A3AL05_HIBSY|nr:Polyadenylate-binding protein-interacting protein 9 [Hibiscus syriacus]